MTKETENRITVIGIIIASVILFAIFAYASYYWFGLDELFEADETEETVEYRQTVTTAAIGTDASSNSQKKDEISKVSDATTGKTSVTTSKPGETDAAIVTSTENSTEASSSGTGSSGEKSQTTTQTEVTETSPDVTQVSTTAVDASAPGETTKSPEESTKTPETTAKPKNTTKSPSTTASPETTSSFPETQYPLVTVEIPSELTEHCEPVEDVLIAPNGDVVRGKWYRYSNVIVFVVELPHLELWEQYRWWSYNGSYNILEFGTYVCYSEDGSCGFTPDVELPPNGSGVVTGGPAGTIPPGSWW